MTVTKDDIRAAVSTGAISEAQAAHILSLSEARQGHRENIEGLDEPFELFRGFNEVFVIVGLVILYTGWAGVVGLTLAFDLDRGSFGGVITALIGLGALALLARYFTLRRRMVGPSIALSIMTALSALQLGLSMAGGLTLDLALGATLTCGIATVVLVLYWWRFRVPFAMLLIALGVFGTAFALTALGGGTIESPQQMFLLTADGPFSVLTVALGLIGTAIALRFDMSDPHRVTRRSANGFWLHIIAAPAIVNTVALTLFQIATPAAYLALLAFVTVMALFAVVIDRRSFLVSGIGYVVAVLVVLAEGQAALVILILGAGLVLLGAQWEKLRSAVMRGMPAFPGKSRLPPWADMKGIA